LEHGLRVLSAYKLRTGQKIWVITEADRSMTAVLLPGEYSRRRDVATPVATSSGIICQKQQIAAADAAASKPQAVAEEPGFSRADRDESKEDE
jgi:hypothetical protein